jgi:DNA-binding transcriptional ArsR family regulator
MTEYTKEQVAQDLRLMYKAGLVDIKMREDGEWIYFATEYAKALSQEEVTAILDNLYEEQLDQEDNESN